ncbi:ATP-grasp domain-containing protein [Fructilactobacillus myrtifloralis]|uniref:carbamoyl-phosphate synthase (ammonia) n=1 Tax=Fructilactobacillus myrtifloralis TaxID=2940301 RepID=A0ABY5BNT0_9LACO|nr:ATP-grasp domain-containing protein [Fructilactobacillus myrtifloralis]USS85335.1 ATP-grasp domain-containing protein [Fructilactobacillus myrtifloralis]
MKHIKKILIIGGGPSDIDHESEQDSAAFQAISAWQRLGIETFVIDNNPYSLLLQETNDDHTFVQSLTAKNVARILKTHHIDGITPIFGTKAALTVVQRLMKNQVLQTLQVQLLGLNATNLNLFGTEAEASEQNTALANRLAENNIPIVASRIISDFSELRNNLEKIQFPISVKPLSTNKKRQRRIFKNMESLNNEIDDLFQESPDQKLSLEREVGNYQEIGIVAIRDVEGNKMLISSLEDMNPVKINATDSVIFTPAQTLNDYYLKRLRSLTFEVLDCLGIKGICHLQFAVNAANDEVYVLKVNPVFNSETALAAKATGYPLAKVVASLLLDIPLTAVELPPRFNPLTTILQPLSDHIVVKMPIWSFDYLDMADNHLGPHAKATGAAIGVGRSAEAALMIGLRSSQPSPQDVLPEYSDLSEDDLIEQLIHPTDQQILILFEAVRRGYSASDLSELTKIDEFFFVIMSNLLAVINQVQTHPCDSQALLMGDRYGFGNGMFCHFWNVDNATIVAMQQELPRSKTYKMIDPTAGEFPEAINSFYGSYEFESDTSQLSNQSALVIGKGRNHLGPNTAADTYTAEMLIQLHKLGYKTIILNNNPNSVSLIPAISDKQYIEPVQLGEILNVIDLEKPKYVFLPGNRHFLIRELQKLQGTFKLIVLPPDQETGTIYQDRADFALDVLVSPQAIIPISTVGFRAQMEGAGNQLEEQTSYYVPYAEQQLDVPRLEQLATAEINRHPLTGLIQVLFTIDSDGNYVVTGITPLRITETIFLNQVTEINWIRVLMQMYTGHFDPEQLRKRLPRINAAGHFAIMQITFPFKHLGINNVPKRRRYEIGAKISFGNSLNDSTDHLLK